MRAIRTPRFVLEPQVEAHAAAMFAVLGDPAIYEYENAPPASEQWLTERYRRLETRRSADGAQVWLNWVVRLPDGELAGYVQATVRPGDLADVAYELGSRHWGRGLGSAAVGAMMAEVAAQYDVARFFATLKRANHRSERLLSRLGFRLASPADFSRAPVEPDEILMHRTGVAVSMEDILLRPATPRDASAVAEVLIRSRAEFMPFAPSAHPPDDVRDWVTRQLVPSGTVTVAEHLGEIVAVLAISTGEGVGWIDQLMVRPGWTRRRLGTTLLLHAHRLVTRPIRLWTFQANVGARRFYESHGYVAIEFTDGASNEERCPDVLYELR